jgi:hypothetical protein
MDEAQARNVVKGIGIENWSRFQQIDQQKKESDARMQAMAAEKAAMEAKAAEAFRKAQQAEQENSILKNVMAGGAPAGTPPPYLAKNGSDAARMDGNAFANRMATMGMPAEKALEYGGKIASMQPKAEKASKIGQTFKVGDTEYMYNTDGSVIEVPKKSDGLKDGETKDFTRDGVTVRAFKHGNKWLEEKSGAPIDIAVRDWNGNVTWEPNPDVFGKREPQSPFMPTPGAGAAVPKPQSESIPVGTRVRQNGKIYEKTADGWKEV